MKRVWRLVAPVAIALSWSPTGAQAETPRPLASREAVARVEVTAVSVLPTAGRTEVVIAVDGAVSVKDFALAGPNRVVLDLTGARLGIRGERYDRVARGGITNLRMSQFSANVVRVVLDLDGPRRYTVSAKSGDVRVAIEGGANFAAWSIGAPGESASNMAEATPVAAAPSIEPAPVAVAQSAPVADASVQFERISPSQAEVTRVTRQARANPAPAPVKAPRARITVTYEDADIRDVLAAFAAFSGRTIVAGRDVKGEVTAEIKDQPWDVALKAILSAHGLAADEDASGIITVDSYQNILAKQASEPLVTQLVQVNYVTAGSLVPTVTTLLSRDCGAGSADGAAPATSTACKARGQVAADSATNMLLVTEVPSRMGELVRYVQNLDVRTPQVSIKARIIAVNRTQTEQLGLSYDLGSANSYFNTLAPRIDPVTGDVSKGEFVVELGGNAFTGVANAHRKYTQSSALDLIFSTTLGKYSLTSFLSALSEHQLSDVQAEPQITTLDNRTARVLVGQETPVRVIDAGGAGGAGELPRANVQFKETGIILEVTPHITSNRQILMNVYAEQSQLNQVGGDLGFFTDKRTARSQVLVADGETAVIAGLTQTQITRNRSGIPLLTDLPFIGRLFSQTDTKEQKQDLLILLTPRIVDEGDAGRGNR